MMWKRKRKDWDGHKWRWDALAKYNSEVARGISHTPEYDAQMAEEQRRFNEESAAGYVAQGITVS